MEKELIIRLPRYADTGAPFVPGRDKAYVINGGNVVSSSLGYFQHCEFEDGRYDDGWVCVLPKAINIGYPAEEFFSTIGAARAAIEDRR